MTPSFPTRRSSDLFPVACEWCEREKQPLLCTRCWQTERLREEDTPMGADEQAATEFLLRAAANNGRLIAQAEADKAMCDGIAEATHLDRKSTRLNSSH